MKNISVKEDKTCNGCGLCQYICPVNAINMEIKDDGSDYPTVDESKCINCGLCIKECPHNNGNVGVEPRQIYAAAIKDNVNLINSASGGVFYSIASLFIEQGGVVYGAAYFETDKSLEVKHIRVNTISSLKKLQGSKYVQSRIFECYELLKKDIEEGTKVLFSGTPCQVAAIKRLFENRINLYTVEIICHGVPGNELFQKYTSYLNNKWKCKVVDFRFRDKIRGWGFTSRIILKKKNRIYQKIVPSQLSSYYYFFLNWDISRESCYHCIYSNIKRQSDITIGDYNGIQIVHPELLMKNGGCFEENNGVSSILINTEKGQYIFEKLRNSIIYVESNLENVTKYNQQLISPCKKGVHRNKLIESVKKDDTWKKYEKTYRKILGVKYYRLLLGEIIKRHNII